MSPEADQPPEKARPRDEGPRSGKDPQPEESPATEESPAAEETPTDEETAADEGGAATAESDADLESVLKENERLRDELAQEHQAHSHRGRAFASIALAVLVALLLPPTVITVWSRNRLLNTDRYVETVAPLASDPAIQSAVSARLSSEVSKAINLKSLAEEWLPDKAKPLSGFIAAGGNNLITQLSDRAVHSRQFEDLWVQVNRVAHEKLDLLLTGQQGTVANFANGEVAIPIKKLADTVLAELQKVTGIDLASRIPTSALSGEFVLFRSEELVKVQSAVKLLNSAMWVLVVLVLASAVGAVFLARPRRVGVRRVGIAILVSTAITLVAVGVGREFYLNQLSGVVQSLAAAGAAFDIITNFLRMTLRAILALGAVMVIGAWLVGPSRAAVRVRSWGSALTSAAGDRTAGRDTGPIPRFVGTYERPLQWGIGVVGAAVILFRSHPTGVFVLLVALVGALLIGLVHLVGAVAGSDDSTLGDGAVEGGGALALAGAGPSGAGASETLPEDGVEDGG